VTRPAVAPGRVSVVGAGVAGLAAATRLAEAGIAVTVHDPAPGVGGLAGGFNVGGTSVERFYHHIFHSDRTALAWIDDLGLGSRLEFLPAAMGYFSGGRMHRFGTPLSLIRFQPLPPIDRLRLGLRILRLSRQASPAQFESVSAVEWLRQRASAVEMARFWEPLLEAKFGPDRGEVSMAWLWARFRARVGDKAGLGERLGYLRGGFQSLPDAMAERARGLGVEIRLGDRITAVNVEAGRVAGVSVEGKAPVPADIVLWTASLQVLARAVPGLPAAYRETCAGIRYHTALVAVVELQESVLPYYWVTVGDRGLPFTVAVEHTRLVGTADYAGRTIVYLGRYISPDDPLAAESDESVKANFLAAAAEHFSPRFREPLAVHLFRAPAAQPILPPGWGSTRPPLRTGLPGLVAANMAQIYPWDRGINYSIELGEEAARVVQAELSERRPGVRAEARPG
jgi:protoporphyrinogen oxidase